MKKLGKPEEAEKYLLMAKAISEIGLKQQQEEGLN
jgi:hypothetical protein